MGSNFKQNRVNEEIKRAVASILSEVKDPRIPPMPTVVSVEVTGDQKYAKIYLSFLGNYNESEVRKGLKENLILRQPSCLRCAPSAPPHAQRYTHPDKTRRIFTGIRPT